MNVPGFIARQFYVAGSLRNNDDGFQLEAHNPLGSGTLIGVGSLRVDGRDIAPTDVTAQRSGDATPINAADVSSTNPIQVAQGDRVTLRVRGEPLAAGRHELDVELVERNVGRLAFSIADTLAG
jgi:hypothetical protein